ncbi:hypothetical protein EPVG_00376 [Emiliania huxleyi virus 201]|nr:hypothetical protein ELVG_00001 [Emiliania huxleyi virus 203]AEP15411.1 hypothetical protein EQVG_00001 [Emiliania huxleyi virus 207]AEP16046.1 hypothetical protein ERVG_00170 [Emiliania huxleyi virus 208]AET98263.1 hypothetical protein EPVG_00376 [Emiliania huxleyi virus 201]
MIINSAPAFTRVVDFVNCIDMFSLYSTILCTLHLRSNINLFNQSTWKRYTKCASICDTYKVSDAFRYRHPRVCYTHNVSTLLSARTYPISTSTLNKCKGSTCPFEGNLLTSYPSNPTRSNVNNIQIPSYKTCAVVGSGMGAMGFGYEIDQHHAVIRINDAPIDQQYMVGSKTTHRILACWPIHGKSIPMCSKYNDPSTLWIGGYNIYKLGNRGYWKINNTNTLCQSYKGWGKCSTGLWAVSFALSTCNIIDLYGFMPSHINETWQYSRYYQTDSYTKHDAGHNYIFEKSKLYSLHCNDKITVKS